MPELARVAGYRICIHFDEIPPPHFHCFKSGKGYRFRIDTLEQLANDEEQAPDGLCRLIRKWALANNRQSKLLKAWNECQRGMNPGKVD